MTQDEIIEMARRAGFDPHDMSSDFTCNLKDINSFAKLVAQHEREACAKVCDLAMLQNQEAINVLENDEYIAKCFIQGAMTQLVKTSKAIRACSRANSCAEPPPGNDSRNNLTATSGISLDSAPALRQNFINRSKCTLHQYSVFSVTFNPRPSTIRTTHAFGCSATILSFPSLMLPILQSPTELSTFFSP
jgi:hypothetical protein